MPLSRELVQSAAMVAMAMIAIIFAMIEIIFAIDRAARVYRPGKNAARLGAMINTQCL